MIRRGLLFALALVLCAFALSQPGGAAKKAFILGNNAYDHFGRLSTAVNDAAAMEDALRAVDFSAVRMRDATLPEFAEKWREFLGSLQRGDVAAFYFAGHGFQVDGANYLALKDTRGLDAGESALLQSSLNFHELMEQLEARELARTLYILDACRVSPVEGKRGRANQGQARGLAAIESLYGAFIMYSASPDEEALDFLADPAKERNSVYARRLLALLKNKDLSISDVATRVRVQVEEDAKAVNHRQRPAYFDGITGPYYVARMIPPGKQLDPNARVSSSSVVRLGGFASWDNNCQNRPAPRVTAATRPRYGRIMTRFESFTVGGKHAGDVSCNDTTQKGIGVYYVIDDAAKDRTAVDSVQLTVKHWSVTPSVAVTEIFDIDLATRHSKRITGR